MKTERINEVLETGFRYAKYKMCLSRNRIKEDSRTYYYEQLLEYLKEEIRELEEKIEYYELCARNNESDLFLKNCLEEIALEAADVINYACMICDKTEEV